ncbi:MAG: replicative DNA helicase [Mycoplasmataceae bacterium]|jgi:replicative DNA helicase|nr:replicative DNA helicase [Mycoplasmataceae bacterium]
MANEITNNQLVEPIERELISEILNDTSIVEDAILKLEPVDFVNRQMASIFNTIIKLHTDAKTISEHTILNYISTHKEMQFDDYELVVKTLANKFVSTTDFEDHIDLIKNASIKRQLNTFADEIITTDMDITKFNELLYNFQNKMAVITSAKRSNKIASMSDIAQDYSKDLQRIISHDEEVTGTPSGFSLIDAKTNGFQPGDLIILAARPGVGKTALALNFLVNAAKDCKERAEKTPNNEIVLMFSLEMSSKELCNRIVSSESMIELSPSKRSRLSNIEHQSVNNTIDAIADLPIYIDDDSSLTILDVQSKIKQIAMTHKIRLVVVDYLGLLKAPTTHNNLNNRQAEVAMFSRTFKQIARMNNIPVLVLAQLNRNMEQRGKKADGARPMLSDLRDSGAIEQDADIVTFLSKVIPEDEEEDNKKESSTILIEYNIAKNRKGPTGLINLDFIKNISRFEEKRFVPVKGVNESKSFN